MKKHPLLNIFLRYIILILVALPNLYLFHIILTPITINFVSFFLSLIYSEVGVSGSSIFLNGFRLDIVEACVASSAYYLLFILNLSISGIKITKRIQMILFSFGFLFAVNIVRIILLAIMVNNGSLYFDVVHKFFWYFLSTIFVVGIWFLGVWMFKIKQIPFMEDLKFLYNNSIFKKKK